MAFEYKCSACLSVFEISRWKEANEVECQDCKTIGSCSRHFSAAPTMVYGHGVDMKKVPSDFKNRLEKMKSDYRGSTIQV